MLCCHLTRENKDRVRLVKTNVYSSGNGLPKSDRLCVNGRLYAILIVAWHCKVEVEELPFVLRMGVLKVWGGRWGREKGR